MPTFAWIIIVVVVIVAACGVYLWRVNNALVSRNLKAKEAWSDMTVQLKRRADLIPNLEEAVKGYAAHESETLTALAQARAKVLAATGPAEAAEAADDLQTAVKGLSAVVESYPELLANRNYLHLQDQLVDTEDKIQASRRLYNGVVRDLNTRIGVFPNSLFAKRLGFTLYEFFDAPNAGEDAPTISFARPTTADNPPESI